MGPTPEAELHLRAARAEQQVADLKAALENIKTERDRWRTIAERRSLPDQPAESTLARREVAGLVVAAERVALIQGLAEARGVVSRLSGSEALSRERSRRCAGLADSAALSDVRFTPESGHVRRKNKCPLSARIVPSTNVMNSRRLMRPREDHALCPGNLTQTRLPCQSAAVRPRQPR